MISIVIVGVGGQGTLLASRILGQLAIAGGYDVKVSEVHGMSQRGGNVITHVRMDKENPVHSPLVEQGGADAVLAMEKLEALRALPYLKDGGLLVTSTQEILPLPVITGVAQYPQDALERLNAQADVRAFDAAGMARDAGDLRAANVALMGAMSHALPFSEAEWKDALRICVPTKALDVNLKAFDLGRSVR